MSKKKTAFELLNRICELNKVISGKEDGATDFYDEQVFRIVRENFVDVVVEYVQIEDTLNKEIDEA